MVNTLNEEKFSLCCNAPALGGKEEYGFCGDCEEQTEFLTEEEYWERFGDDGQPSWEQEWEDFGECY
tara:strand:- start:3506 stop:3706 length:201 start_codon:yes stop_codon:yes gene_type:complete